MRVAAAQVMPAEWRGKDGEELARYLTSTFFLGLDLGQTTDYTALCVLEQIQLPTAIPFKPGGGPGGGGRQDILMRAPAEIEKLWPKYNLSHLERMPLGTSYPDVERIVQERLAAIPVEGRNWQRADHGALVELVIDNTGVGRPVSDMFRAAGLRPHCITITGGTFATISGAGTGTQSGHSVPKRDLVGILQVFMQQRRLKVAQDLPEAQTLVKQMQNFKYKIAQTGHDTYNAREGEHDDLVLACAVACWAAQQGLSSIPRHYNVYSW